MATQNQISILTGFHQSDISRLFNGKKPVSWPQAQKLSELFPDKDIVAWKNSTPEDLKRAFSQLEEVVQPGHNEAMVAPAITNRDIHHNNGRNINAGGTNRGRY